MLGYDIFSFASQDTSYIESKLNLPRFHEGKLSIDQKIVIVDETNQVTGSFKVRGALYAIYRIRQMQNVKNIRITAASSGNFGLGVAHVCNEYGIPCTIYLPKNTPTVKKNYLTNLGAIIRDEFDSYDSAKKSAIHESKLVEETHKFIDGACIDTFAGNTSLIKQIDQKYNLNDSDLVVVPFGIGSLYLPTLVYSEVSKKKFSVVAIEPKLANKFSRKNQVMNFPNILFRRTIASGADVKSLPPLTSSLLDLFNPKVYSVKEKQIRRALMDLYFNFGIKAEGAGGLSYAYALKQKSFSNSKRVICIVTGGNI
jgi:threonine dehydratase